MPQDTHILVDGYSILHQWADLAPAFRRGLAAGRDALILIMTRYHDCHGGALTLVFDGRSLPRGGEAIRSGINVLFSKDGQTADSVIERIVGQSVTPERYLVATDDHAEQNTVEALGARSVSADIFHRMVQEELDNLADLIEKNALKGARFRR